MAKNEVEMNDTTDAASEGVLRVYELGFHLDPELPTEEVKTTYQAILKVVEDSGTVVALGEPLHIQLAYTISRQEPSGRRDFDAAYFSWIAYEASVEGHEAVLEAVKDEKRVIRFIDLVTTSDAARHSAELRELAMKTPEASDDAEEEAADAELDAALESAAA